MVDFAERFRRLGTAVLADAAFRMGARLAVPTHGLALLDGRTKMAGPAVTVEANNDLVAILSALSSARRGDVLVIAGSDMRAALIGDLIGAEAQRIGLAGILVDGLVRDVVALVAMQVPVMARGAYPVGPLKLEAEHTGIGTVGAEVSIGGALIASGTWVFADADGAVFVDPGDLDEIFAAAEAAEEQERALAARISSGEPLGDALGLSEFLAKRKQDPGADFNRHLAEGGEAI